MKFCPSYNADDAFPVDVANAPDIINMRSGSIMPLAAWVFVNGTIVKSATMVPGANADPKFYWLTLFNDVTKTIPKAVHFTPSQNVKNEVPSEDLPAAKRLLEFPLFTSTASTGPGISEPEPTATQVALEKLYLAT